MFDNEARRNPRLVDKYRDIWHRTASLQRFLGQVAAVKLKMIDIDACEFCPVCRNPYAIKETKHVNERQKFWHVTSALATKAKIPGYLVVYETGSDDDISKFEITNTAGRVQIMEPHLYAQWLWDCLCLHLRNDCTYKKSKQVQSLLEWKVGR